MEVSEKINPNFEEKTSNALKADRTVHRVTFNPNKASPGKHSGFQSQSFMREQSWFQIHSR